MNRWLDLSLLFVSRIACVASMQTSLEMLITDLVQAQTDFALTTGSLDSAVNDTFSGLAPGATGQDNLETGNKSEPMLGAKSDPAQLTSFYNEMTSNVTVTPFALKLATEVPGALNLTDSTPSTAAAVENAGHVQSVVAQLRNGTRNVTNRSAQDGREAGDLYYGPLSLLDRVTGVTDIMIKPFRWLSAPVSVSRKQFAWAESMLYLIVFFLIFGLASEGDQGGLYKKALARMETAGRTITSAMGGVEQRAQSAFTREGDGQPNDAQGARASRSRTRPFKPNWASRK